MLMFFLFLPGRVTLLYQGHSLLLGWLQWSVNPCVQVTPLLAGFNPLLNTWAQTLQVVALAAV